jgi:allantoate deiminase
MIRSFPDLTLEARQLADRLEELGKVSDEPDRLVRTFLSPASLRANALVGQWMKEAGLTVDEDSFGNLIGTRPGPPGSGKWVIGSHLDTVVDAGRFDGPAGVLLGIAVAAALPELPFGLEVVGFSDEEGVRFQSTYLGSRAYAGLITEQELKLRGKDGISVGELVEARRREGYPDQPAEVESLLGYLEVHIEQGPVLEAAELPLAVVPGVAGQTRIWAGFTGKAGHAGTTPMPLRRDALTAVARMVLETEAYAKAHPPLLATVGTLEVRPGAGNVIPGEAGFSLDVRSPDNTARAAALAFLAERGAALARELQLAWHWQVKQDHGAVTFDARLTDRLAQAVAAQQSPVPHLFSGAGHDAAVMAGVCPAAMLFVRCLDGLSHHPDEYASPADLAAALQATVRFMLTLAEESHA